MVSLTDALGDDAPIVRDRSLQLLLLAVVVYPLGTTSISPILESLIDPFSTSAAAIGLMMTTFFAPAIVISPLAGVLTDRYGRKPVLVIGLVVFGLAGTSIALTDDFAIILGLRLLQGVGAAGILPVVVTSLGDLYWGSAGATAQGMRSAVHGTAGMVYPLLSGVLVAFAWQYPFLMYAMSIPIALIVYRYFEEPTDATEPTETEVPPRGDHLHQLGALVARPPVMAAVLGMFVTAFVFTAFLTYNSLIVVRGAGGTASQSGAVVAILSIASAIMATQAGRIYGWFRTPLYPLAGLSVALGGGLVVVALATSLLPVAIGSVILGSGFGLLFSLYRNLLSGFAPTALRGGLVSIGETAKGTAAAGAPLIMGVFIIWGEPFFGPIGAVRATNAAVGVAGIGVGIILAWVITSGADTAS